MKKQQKEVERVEVFIEHLSLYITIYFNISVN